MTRTYRTLHEELAPIIPDWTIRSLLDWLSDDALAHDAALRRPLHMIDRALTRTSWEQEPSTVALVRSIASAVRAAPRLRNMRLDDLLLLPGAPVPKKHPYRARIDAFVRPERMLEPERVPEPEREPERPREPVA